jgi:hypothetical protein
MRQHHKQCHANCLENRPRLKSELFRELEGQCYLVLKLEVEIQTFTIVEGAKVNLALKYISRRKT